MKKLFSAFALSGALLVTLSACGGSSSASSTPDAKPKTPQEIDADIYRTVTNVESRMDSLSDGIVSMSVGNLSMEDLYDSCEVAIADVNLALETVKQYEDDEAISGYVDAAQDVLNNVGAAHIKMQDFLDGGTQEDLEYAMTCIDNRDLVNVPFVAARQQYLTDSGLSSDDIAKINEELGISVE